MDTMHRFPSFDYPFGYCVPTGASVNISSVISNNTVLKLMHTIQLDTLKDAANLLSRVRECTANHRTKEDPHIGTESNLAKSFRFRLRRAILRDRGPHRHDGPRKHPRKALEKHYLPNGLAKPENRC